MRYTSTPQEIRHLVDVNEKIGLWGIRHITLTNGQKYIGLITGSKCGNNGVPHSAYYGEVTILTLDNKQINIDLLDIKSVFDVTDNVLSEFEKAGLVKIVDLPASE